MNKEQALAALRLVCEFVERSGDPWHKKGYEFESRFADMCDSRGYSCTRAGRGHFDFVVNGLRVQCKRLNPDASGYVCVQPGSGSAYERNSFDVLVVETDEGIHIVPENDIPSTSRSGLLRAATSIEFLRKYSEAWWVLESSMPPKGFEVQLKLDLSQSRERAANGR